MRILNCKGKQIESLEEWKSEFYTGIKNGHWKDGCSAAETAKSWLFHPPQEFVKLFSGRIVVEEIFPECNTSFDKFNGGVRNHDLLVIAKNDTDEKIVACIESKVSERFSSYNVGEYLTLKIGEINEGKDSNVPKRISNLKKALFRNENDVRINQIRYQLLTAVAGTLAEAKKHDVRRVYFIVQTILTDEMNSEIHRTNERDLDFLIEVISNGKFKIIHDGDLLKIGTVPGNEYIPNNVELYIGKYSVRI